MPDNPTESGSGTNIPVITDEPTPADTPAPADLQQGDAGGSAEGLRIRQLQALLDESTSRAAQTAERLKDTHERYVRVSADFENWKKRAAKEKLQLEKAGNEKIIRDLLPVIDNLERAVAAGSGGMTLLDGVRLVLRQFSEVLGRNGVKTFSSVGETFDPARHEALMQQEGDAPANTVMHELVRGYVLGDKLLRPAAVVVSKGRPAAPPPPAPQSPDGAAQPSAAAPAASEPAAPDHPTDGGPVA
jgi:molecular chaperone GrpE